MLEQIRMSRTRAKRLTEAVAAANRAMNLAATDSADVMVWHMLVTAIQFTKLKSLDFPSILKDAETYVQELDQ